MAKADLVKELKESFGFEAREELQVPELQALLTGFKAQADNKDAKALIEDMQNKVKEATVQAAGHKPKVVATSGETSYLVCPGGCVLPGVGTFTAKEIAENEEVVNALLKIDGQTILTPLK